MPPRRLNPEELALWAKVSDSVTPVRGRKPNPRSAELIEASSFLAAPLNRMPLQQAQGYGVEKTKVQHEGRIKNTPNTQNTLDANWDKRLSKGTARPDYVIDLHEHNLASAHARLDQGLANAVAEGARVVLLITGKARGAKEGGADNPRLPPTTRGVIRATVPDWLAGSRWTTHIAAIRNAHPRHGGAGALYLIMRRPRG